MDGRPAFPARCRLGDLSWALAWTLGALVLAAGVVIATTASLAVTAAVFDAHQWGVFLGANLLLAATYALLGVCLGPLFGRVSGVLIAFLVPFLDLGIGQSPMLRTEPPTWAQLLPGYGPYRVLLDGGLTNHFDTTGPLLLGLAWLTGLATLVTWLFRHTATDTHARKTRRPTTSVPACRVTLDLRGVP